MDRQEMECLQKLHHLRQTTATDDRAMNYYHMHRRQCEHNQLSHTYRRKQQDDKRHDRSSIFYVMEQKVGFQGICG